VNAQCDKLAKVSRNGHQFNTLSVHVCRTKLADNTRCHDRRAVAKCSASTAEFVTKFQSSGSEMHEFPYNTEKEGFLAKHQLHLSSVSIQYLQVSVAEWLARLTAM